jgi:hypothetical protein
LLVFTSIVFSQKKINWGEDPVNLHYNGFPGMITAKTLYNPLVSTQGHSGKWTSGLGGNGLIIDIDSVDFFTPGKKIYDGIGYLCGNPIRFPDAINREKILVVKKTVINKVVQFLQCDSLQEIAKNLGLLKEDISKRFSRLDKKMGNIENLLDNLREEKSSSEGGWIIPTVVGIALAAILTYIAWPKNNVRNISLSDGGILPPN